MVITDPLHESYDFKIAHPDFFTTESDGILNLYPREGLYLRDTGLNVFYMQNDADSNLEDGYPLNTHLFLGKLIQPGGAIHIREYQGFSGTDNFRMSGIHPNNNIEIERLSDLVVAEFFDNVGKHKQNDGKEMEVVVGDPAWIATIEELKKKFNFSNDYALRDGNLARYKVTFQDS